MQDNQESQKSFKDRVLENIESKNVTMRSKAHFRLAAIALILVALLTLVVSIFLCTFILFSVRISGHEPLLSLGARGLVFFLQLFPWTFLLVDILLIGILEWMLRKFPFGYKRPVLYTILGLLVITISVSVFIDRATGFNEALLRRADEHHLPSLFGDLYEHAGHPQRSQNGVCKCTITSINGNVLSAEDRDINKVIPLIIILPANDPQLSTLHVGDTILVAGDIASGTIRAFGIRPLNRNTNFPQK
jgi:hypothetical protein